MGPNVRTAAPPSAQPDGAEAPNSASRPKFVLWNAVALLAGLIPVAIYWAAVGRVPSVGVAEAQAELARDPSSVLLLDVRPAARSAARPIPGAVNVPWPALRGMATAADLPEGFAGKRVLVICDSGIKAAPAVRRLRALGLTGARRVSGGMEAWQAYGDGRTSAAPRRPMSLFEQWLAVIIAFGVKPAYMLLAFALIVWLWRRRDADLAALRWGLIWFWLGETGCSIDYLFYARGSGFWEYVHGFGMAAGFAFIAFAALDGMDRRVLKYSPPNERCAALGLCRACAKSADAPCALERLFALMLPALAAVALMPLSGGFVLDSYDAIILGRTTHYHHLVSSQWFELRFCPLIAAGLLIAAWLVLLFKRPDPVPASKALLAAGLGPMGFGILRLVLVATFRERLVWFDAWEEMTELIAIFAIAAVLWAFRASLFAPRRAVGPGPAAA
jgi:rhodanese-related sulfurtransferase